MQKKKIGIVGGTGYTGIELLRLLVNHPHIELKAITSRANNSIPVAEYFPGLRGSIDIAFSNPTLDNLGDCDLVFFATPNGIAMKMVPELLENGIKVIDLAADFRISNVDIWEKWYGMTHACPEYIGEAVYGLPEIKRAAIKTARLVANPGCYPTAVQLGFIPLLEEGAVNIQHLIADVKSGVSGAGRNPQLRSLYCEADESFQAYAASGHRHLVEITQELSGIKSTAVDLTFVPHLVPMTRGIHATLYSTLLDEQLDLQKLYEDRYAAEPFVDVLPWGEHPDTKTVRGTNTCRIAIHKPQNGNKVVVLSVIDNLVKGAAGQAIQNMNIMLGFAEAAGIDLVPLMV